MRGQKTSVCWSLPNQQPDRCSEDKTQQMDCVETGYCCFDKGDFLGDNLEGSTQETNQTCPHLDSESGCSPQPEQAGVDISNLEKCLARRRDRHRPKSANLQNNEVVYPYKPTRSLQRGTIRRFKEPFNIGPVTTAQPISTIKPGGMFMVTGSSVDQYGSYDDPYSTAMFNLNNNYGWCSLPEDEESSIRWSAIQTEDTPYSITTSLTFLGSTLDGPVIYDEDMAGLFYTVPNQVGGNPNYSTFLNLNEINTHLSTLSRKMGFEPLGGSNGIGLPTQLGIYPTASNPKMQVLRGDALRNIIVDPASAGVTYLAKTIGTSIVVQNSYGINYTCHSWNSGTTQWPGCIPLATFLNQTQLTLDPLGKELRCILMNDWIFFYVSNKVSSEQDSLHGSVKQLLMLSRYNSFHNERCVRNGEWTGSDDVKGKKNTNMAQLTKRLQKLEMDKKNKKKNKSKQKKQVKLVVRQERQVLPMSECARHFLRAIADPFNPRSTGVCIPTSPARETMKTRAFMKLNVAIGAGGVGFICFSPCTANDSPTVWFTNATFTGTTTQLYSSGDTLVTGVSSANMSTLPFAKASLLPSGSLAPAVGGLVACFGVRARCTAPELDIGGTAVSYVSPSRSSVAGQTIANIQSFSSADTVIIDSKRRWVEAHAYASNPMEMTYELQERLPTSDWGNPTSVGVALYPMSGGETTGDATPRCSAPIGLIAFTGTPGNTFYVEIITHNEYYGMATQAMSTPKIADPVGLDNVITIADRAISIMSADNLRWATSIGRAVGQIASEFYGYNTRRSIRRLTNS